MMPCNLFSHHFLSFQTNNGHTGTSEVIQNDRKTESEDPLYANIEPPATPKRNSMRQSKKSNKQESEESWDLNPHQTQQQSKQKSSRTGAESSAAKKLLQSAIQENDDNTNDTINECGFGSSWNPQKTLVHLYTLPDVKVCSIKFKFLGSSQRYLIHE